MAFFSLKTTTKSLFLLLHAITLFSHCHASKHDKDHGSLVLGLTHSRVLSPLSVAARGLKPLEVVLQKGFCHCFLGYKFANNPNITSPLLIGDLAISSKEDHQFTPMLKSPIYPNSYYVGLEGISVGSNGTIIEGPLNLKAFDSEGNGGMLIDSGTTYTHLPDPFYSHLLSELGSRIAYMRSNELEERTLNFFKFSSL